MKHSSQLRFFSCISETFKQVYMNKLCEEFLLVQLQQICLRIYLIFTLIIQL